MRALIWKEIRENLMWAALALVCLGLAMGYALEHRGQDSVSITGRSFLLVTTFGSALWGVVLGILQIALESNRDRRAFLLHRPISRTKIFAGKAIGGLVLCLLPGLLPLFLAAWWASSPARNPEPFAVELIYPGLADMLAGVVFYFAGMLSALRPARWYATRAIALPAAIGCAVAVQACPEFWQALACIVVFAGMLGTAAWGSFLFEGDYAPQPRFAKAALALAVTAGLGVLSIVFTGLVVSTYYSSMWLPVNYEYPDTAKVFKEMPSGYEPAGERKLQPQFRYDLETGFFWQSGMLFLDKPWKTVNFGYRNSQRYFVRVGYYSRNPDWFYIFSERKFVGFSYFPPELLGTIGKKGFAKHDTLNPPFDEDWITSLWNYPYAVPYYLNRGGYAYGYYPGMGNIFEFPTALYSINFPGHKMTEFFTPPAGQTIRAAAVLYGQTADPRSDEQPKEPPKTQIAVIVGDMLYIVTMEDKKVTFTHKLRHDTRVYDQVLLRNSEASEILQIAYNSTKTMAPGDGKVEPQYVDVIHPNGELLEIKAEYRPAPLSRDVHIGAITPFLLAPPPGFAATLFEENSVHSFWNTPGGALKFAASLFAMLLSVLASILISRRYAFSSTATLVWAIYILATGFVGLVTYVTIQDWPIKRDCNSCSKKRLVTRETCEHCGAEFQPPTRDGTEIIEPA